MDRIEVDVQASIEIPCPHCGAPVVFFLDPTEGERQELLEDCQTCCRPIVFRVVWRRGKPRVTAEALEE